MGEKKMGIVVVRERMRDDECVYGYGYGMM